MVHKVLIVEDDAAIRTLLLTALRRANLEAESAADGAAALERVKAETFAVILLDLMLPKVSGPEFLKAFNEIAPRANTIVIIMSAYADSLQDRIPQEKVHAVIPKPFDIVKMVEMVKAATETFVEEPIANRHAIPAVRASAGEH